jgi:RecA-family ATPase
VPASAEIEFSTEWKSLKEGGLSELQIEIMRGGYSLVIIDTLSRAIGRSDQLDPAEMTIVIGSLQNLAITLNIAILVIDHHRKTNGFESSPIDDILGSTAKAAVADGALGLYKTQGKQGATLKVTGRDMEEQELSLSWDGLTCCWQSLGNANDVREDTVKGDILRAIRELKEADELPTTAKIAKHLGADRGFISHMLADLWTAGKVRKAEKVGREQPYELIK